MKKLQVVCGILAMAVFIYCVADLTGVVDYVNNVVNEKNGWVETDYGYARSIVVETKFINFTIMKDPDRGFNVYTGAVKKEALDRMTHIEDVQVELLDDESDEHLYIRLKGIAYYKNGNTIIVNGRSIAKNIKTESWGIGL